MQSGKLYSTESTASSLIDDDWRTVMHFLEIILSSNQENSTVKPLKNGTNFAVYCGAHGLLLIRIMKNNFFQVIAISTGFTAKATWKD